MQTISTQAVPTQTAPRRTQHFIVIGNPISHSKSPDIHHAFAGQFGLDIAYQRLLCPCDEMSFSAVVQAFFYGGGVGANVTLPFKEMAYQLCEKTGRLSPAARLAGAVNTLAMKDGRLYGDNTDGRGLVLDLTKKGVALAGRSVAVLGAGGATRGALLPLLEAGANVVIFNRTLSKAEGLVAAFSDFLTAGQTLDARVLSPSELSGAFDVVINATSAGTTNQSLGLETSTLKTEVAYDMMYGKPTEFLEHFSKTATVYDGLGMLISQAAFSFELWTGVAAQSLDLAGVEAMIKREIDDKT